MTDTATIPDSGSESWEFFVGDATGIAITASRQPYDIDVEEKRRGEPDSAYSRVEKFETFYSGPKTVTQTGEKTFVLTGLEGVIRVTVTNNSGDTITPQLDVPASASTPTFREDGKQMVDAKEGLVDTLQTEEIDNIVMASETISGAQGVEAALDEVAGSSTRREVWVVGNGDHPISYQKAVDLSNVTIRTIGGATLTHDGEVEWLIYPENGFDDALLNIDVDLGGERGVTIPNGASGTEIIIRQKSGSAVTDSMVRVGDSLGGATLTDIDINLNAEASSDRAVKLNSPTEMLSITGRVRGFNKAVFENNNNSHGEPRVDLQIIDSNGVNFGTGALNHPNIRVTGNITGDAVVCSPYDGVIWATATVSGYGMHIIDGRDSLIRGSVEDGSEHGVHLDLQTAGGHKDTDATKHTVDVQTSNFDKAGCLLSGATFCRVRGQFNQNSAASAGAWSGVQLEDGPSSTEPSVNNNISVTAVDTHSTKTQEYGVEETQNSDHNVIHDCFVDPNLTGGVSTVGANTVTSNNKSTSA